MADVAISIPFGKAVFNVFFRLKGRGGEISRTRLEGFSMVVDANPQRKSYVHVINEHMYAGSKVR